MGSLYCDCCGHAGFFQKTGLDLNRFCTTIDSIELLFYNEIQTKSFFRRWYLEKESIMSNWTPNSGLNRFRTVGLQRGLLFGVIILTALIAFEAFNFSTTQFALSDLLGSLTFAGFRWSTILSIAFCGIDFAGIARLFSPISDQKGPDEVWYLFGAWLLAATMNAVLTWWGVSIALINHQTQSSAVIDPNIVMRVVPIVVSVMVWLIRIMIIGTFSMAGERIFTITGENQSQNSNGMPSYQRSSMPNNPSPFSAAGAGSSSHSSYRPSHRPVWPNENQPVSAVPNENQPAVNDPSPNYSDRSYSRPEPTYHEISASPSRPQPRGNGGKMH
jgi:hypothetical protein